MDGDATGGREDKKQESKKGAVHRSIAPNYCKLRSKNNCFVCIFSVSSEKRGGSERAIDLDGNNAPSLVNNNKSSSSARPRFYDYVSV
jgi:hypothetical protein